VTVLASVFAAESVPLPLWTKPLIVLTSASALSAFAIIHAAIKDSHTVDLIIFFMFFYF
jgi:C-terminal processing protease CtpA/Prc